jgi:hypothetical protein
MHALTIGEKGKEEEEEEGEEEVVERADVEAEKREAEMKVALMPPSLPISLPSARPRHVSLVSSGKTLAHGRDEMAKRASAREGAQAGREEAVSVWRAQGVRVRCVGGCEGCGALRVCAVHP